MEGAVVRSARRIEMPTVTIKSNAGHQATLDLAMVLNAKMLQLQTQNAKALHDSWDEIMHDPKRCLGVLVALTNLVAQIGIDFYPGSLRALVDYFIDQALED